MTCFMWRVTYAISECRADPWFSTGLSSALVLRLGHVSGVSGFDHKSCLTIYTIVHFQVCSK